MLSGIIFPTDPVEGRLFYLKMEDEINKMRFARYPVCCKGMQIGIFEKCPKGWKIIHDHTTAGIKKD